jgi:hypothetical protein
VRDNSQAAVAPELPLGSKPVWRIGRGDNLRRSDRTQLRNASQQSDGAVSAALGQHAGFGLLAQFPNVIQLFIEPCRALPHTRFTNLSQPLLALCGLVNTRPLRPNATASVNGFNPKHRSVRVSGEGLIGPYHFFQRPRLFVPVPDRSHHADP